MILVRKQHTVFGDGKFEWLDVRSPVVAAYERSNAGETILFIHNLSDENQTISMENSTAKFMDVLNAGLDSELDENRIGLKAFEFRWLMNKD